MQTDDNDNELPLARYVSSRQQRPDANRTLPEPVSPWTFTRHDPGEHSTWQALRDKLTGRFL